MSQKRHKNGLETAIIEKKSLSKNLAQHIDTQKGTNYPIICQTNI